MSILMVAITNLLYQPLLALDDQEEIDLNPVGDSIQIDDMVTPEQS